MTCPKNGYQKDIFSKEIGLRAGKYDNHLRFNNQHNWEDRYDHLINEHENLHFGKE